MRGNLCYFSPLLPRLLLPPSLICFSPLRQPLFTLLSPHQLTSSDRDKPPYNERTYQFAANSTDTDRFEVDTYTGEVRVNNASFPNGPMLDYDGEDNTFTLTLEVTDGVQ